MIDKSRVRKGSQSASRPAEDPPRAQARPRRSYDDGCAAAHALDLIGERWALLVVRELLLGPRRFSELRHTLGNISPNVLTQRLADLEASGVLVKRTLQPPASCQVYALTPWGAQLELPLLELLRWGVRSPAFVRGQALTADAMALSFKVMFAPHLAKSVTVRVSLVMSNHAYHVAVDHQRIAVARGSPPCHPAEAGHWASAILYAEPQAVLHLAYGKRPLDDALVAGDCTVEGDAQALQRFFACFEVPPPVSTVTDTPAAVDMIHLFS